MLKTLRFDILLVLFLVYLFLFRYGVAHAQPIPDASDTTINKTLSLIQQADQIIRDCSTKDAILVLGISGVGKTPFTKWMTQDNAKLKSIRNPQGGPYLMEDTDHSIGTNTLVSATIFPTLYENASTNTSFYDFPGFEDTRGTDYNIATTYASKGVVYKTRRIKLIFLVDYNSVNSLSDRNAFRNFLTYVCEFLTDMNKFKDSIAIVISKVPKYINDEEASDEQVIKNVANFIKTQVQSILQEESQTITFDKEKTFYTRALSFISIILTRTTRNNSNDEYTKIGLFRLPDRAGPFSDIPLVQNGKNRIDQIIRSLNFTEIAANDFNYVIPDATKINLDKLTQKMNDNINAVISQIGKNIISMTSSTENKTYDITKLHSELQATHKALSNAQKLAINSSIEQCVQLVDKSTVNLRNNFPLNDINSYTHFLLFLQSFSIDAITPADGNCFQGLANAIDYLNDSQKWYKFLRIVYDSMSDYNVQRNTTTCKNAIPNVNANADNQTTIRGKLQTFFKECGKKDGEYDLLGNITLDGAKLNALYGVLNYTLHYSSELSCGAEKLVLKGRFVKFSDIVNNANTKCPQPIKIMQVFAFDKVFIDASLNKTGDKFQLSIMAPVWDIQIEQKIILNGLPGRAHEPPKALDGLTAADNGITPGGDGTNGKPGLPGDSAGRFLGIGEIFLNIEKLTVSANGGDGGPGQHGGDGGHGGDGYNRVAINPGDVYKIRENQGRVTKNIKSDAGHIHQSHVVYPQRNCTSGGNGGAGGNGGYGGNPGVFFIPLVRNVTIPTIMNATGNRGSPGTGGRRGDAGAPGEIITVDDIYIHSATSTVTGYSQNHYNIVNRTPHLLCKDGKDGITDYIKSDTKPEALSFSIFISTINDYKYYLREDLLINSQTPVNETFLEHFHNLLENNTHEYYNTPAFVNELYNLERHFIRLGEKVFYINELLDADQLNTLRKKKLLSNFYKSLFRRINQYKNQNGDKDQELFNYLRIAILSKTGFIDGNLGDYLVIDIRKYLQNAKQDIASYTKALREVTRNDHLIRFKSIFEEEINRANSITMKQILPEIDKLIIQTNGAIKLLLEEAKTLETNAQNKEEETKDKLQDLKHQLTLKYILGFLQVGSVFLAFAGPVGVAAGLAIGGASTAFQAFVIDTSGLPGSLGKQNAKFTEMIENQQRQLSSEIYAVERELDKHQNDYLYTNLSHIKSTLAVKRAELNTPSATDMYNAKYTAAQKIGKIREEITQLLNNEILILKQDKRLTEVQLNGRLNVLNSVSTIITAGEVAADVYSKIKNHEAKITTASNELGNLGEYIAKIQKDEQEVFSIIPNMMDISKKYSNLSDLSQIDLVTRTWQLQSKVKDLQFRIHQMSDKFTLKEDVMHCISKFENAINTMIQMYQIVQNYIREAQLAEYFKAINSEVKPTTEFGNDYDRLELMIKSNLVMEEYEKGIRAFKQYVFPFAYLYLDQFNYLSHDTALERKNITVLVNDAASQIQKLHDELEKDQTIIRNKYQAYQNPNAKFANESSFYTWNYKDHREDVVNLLQGHAVLFEADIKQSRKINAIKFSEIGVSFKCANSVTQHQLNKQLEQFKINMTHLGNSHYRFKDNFYFIAHEKVSITHSVNENKNKVYANIKQNDPLLSPYALWEISLQHQNKNYEVDNNFSSLSGYTNEEIHLVLEGYGSFIDDNIPVSDNDVKRYYKRSFV